MRLTLLHVIVTVFLLSGGMVLGISTRAAVAGHPVEVRPIDLAMGAALFAAFTGPILRWLCVWPLVPCCPRCGIWVRGFYRSGGPEGLLLVAMPCEHPFIVAGEWVEPLGTKGSGTIGRVAEEAGWTARPDGRIFRPSREYAVTLLDEAGRPMGERRARWPFWFVRWTAQ